MGRRAPGIEGRYESRKRREEGASLPSSLDPERSRDEQDRRRRDSDRTMPTYEDPDPPEGQTR